MENTVRLRDVETADLEAFLAYEHDPEAVRRSRFRPREREAFMAHWTTRVLGDPANLVRTVVVDEGTTGNVAGNIVAWWEGERRFIGYWLGRPYWGRGIGTRALTAFLELETARPLYADPAVGNTGSVRLLEKCGFVATGTVRHGEDEHVVLVLGGGA
ncbi:GNAT family N-acetyltransferase [Streptomyces anulatus]|uniref:GNAT family N-acetyltransferase n=1 Tax=Streptomyces anulatus TaxID=1892 RepID=UPI001D192437|nr:GNAT family protein [Streptomyces anulatus]